MLVHLLGPGRDGPLFRASGTGWHHLDERSWSVSHDTPIAEKIAGYFGGGGHKVAAGFRTYDMTYEDVVKELVKLVPELAQNVE